MSSGTFWSKLGTMFYTLCFVAFVLLLTVIGACIIRLAFDIPDRYLANDELDIPFTIKLLVTVSIVEADKAVAAAEGEARSKKAIADANAYALLTEAKAQQEANRILAESLTPELIQYNTIVKWNGQLPLMQSGGNAPLVPMVNMGDIVRNQ